MSVAFSNAAGASRRSPLEAWYQTSGSGRQVLEGMVLPAALRNPPPREPALSLQDLSWRRRFGCKGPAAESWLAHASLVAPAAANAATVDDSGAMIARLATSEFLIEAVHGSGARVQSAWGELEGQACPAEVYPIARQDFVARVAGRGTHALLRQICNVDFEPLFSARDARGGPILLTSMAGVGVVAFPEADSHGPRVTLWMDPSFAHYFWSTLLAVGGGLPGGIEVAAPGGAEQGRP
jgi:sarcosine oxidase gamma subunit